MKLFHRKPYKNLNVMGYGYAGAPNLHSMLI